MISFLSALIAFFKCLPALVQLIQTIQKHNVEAGKNAKVKESLEELKHALDNKDVAAVVELWKRP